MADFLKWQVELLTSGSALMEQERNRLLLENVRHLLILATIVVDKIGIESSNFDKFDFIDLQNGSHVFIIIFFWFS
jgi:hypothetical protein